MPVGRCLGPKPEFEADLDGAITTPAAVELALNGIYYSLPGNGFNVIFPTVSGSFKAGTMWRQEIVSAGNAVYYSERMLPTLSFSDATEWDADYAVIKTPTSWKQPVTAWVTESSPETVEPKC